MPKKKKKSPDSLKKCTYYIDGMHCASCEVLIEKKFLNKDGIESVDASMGSKKVEVYYKGDTKLELDKLNKEFKEHGYQLSNKKLKRKKDTPIMQMVGGQLRINKTKMKKVLGTLTTVFLMIILFTWFEKLQLGQYVSVDSNSSLITFVLLGLVAGTSSCAALVGGLLLSMTKQWNELYIDSKSEKQKAQPHIMFHIGRLASFTILGGLLGLLGNVVSLDNPVTYSILVIFVSIVMFILAMQMLEVPWAQKLTFSAPKFLTRFAADEKNFKGKNMPLITGALTFFLPCGFTLIAQGIALTTGNFLNGALIMFLFALGTLPTLTIISFTGLKLNSKPHLTAKFNRIAGTLIIFFVLYNMNSQLNVLGLPSLSDIDFSSKNDIKVEQVVAELDEEGNQVITVTAKGFEYIPTSSTTLKVNVPTIINVDNQGIQGCGVYVAATGLFDDYVRLELGENFVRFTPTKTGTFKLTCSMGMVPPITIKVI